MTLWDGKSKRRYDTFHESTIPMHSAVTTMAGNKGTGGRVQQIKQNKTYQENEKKKTRKHKNGSARHLYTRGTFYFIHFT